MVRSSMLAKLSMELSPVYFDTARCAQYDNGKCERGEYCSYSSISEEFNTLYTIIRCTRHSEPIRPETVDINNYA